MGTNTTIAYALFILVKDIKMSELILNYIRDPMALYIQAVGYCSREVFVYANDECGCIA
jgi:hypothetical protein